MATTLLQSISTDISFRVGKDNYVTQVVFIPGFQLIVTLLNAASHLQVFSCETGGDPKLVFNQHQRYIAGVVHLFDDVVASLDSSGITWHSSSGIVLSHLKTGGSQCGDIAKMQDNSLVVLDKLERIHVV